MDLAQQIREQKEAAAFAAAQLLQDGMLVGLGSGSTAEITVAAIGRRVQDGLKIIGVPTSEKTSQLAAALGIPLTTLEDVAHLDLALDGADEIETGSLHLIKGGGGNLLREKLVAAVSARFVIVADERKLSARLGSHSSLPIDVVPFGWKNTAKRLENIGAHAKLRLDPAGKAFVTDGGAYVLDCAFGVIPAPLELQERLNGIVGVIEHGLFLGMASEVIVGGAEGLRRFTPNS
jgi:ribose 5-phosphate isomerase A